MIFYNDAVLWSARLLRRSPFVEVEMAAKVHYSVRDRRSVCTKSGSILMVLTGQTLGALRCTCRAQETPHTTHAPVRVHCGTIPYYCWTLLQPCNVLLRIGRDSHTAPRQGSTASQDTSTGQAAHGCLQYRKRDCYSCGKHRNRESHVVYAWACPGPLELKKLSVASKQARQQMECNVSNTVIKQACDD